MSVIHMNGPKVVGALVHRKGSSCPVCETEFHAYADEAVWSDTQWDEAFKKQGWIKLVSPILRDRVVYVCSHRCAKVARGGR